MVSLVKGKKKYMPCHISLIVEINLPNNNRKFLLVEKTSYVNITENIHLNDKNVIIHNLYNLINN
jgi:hypothetical protein